MNLTLDDIYRHVAPANSSHAVSPLALQMLYDLIDVDGTAPVMDRDDILWNDALPTMVAAALESYEGRHAEGQPGVFAWKGTGTYPPLRLPTRDGYVHAYVGSDGETVGLMSQGRTIVDLVPPVCLSVRSLFMLGYAGLTPEGALRLTKVGRGILSIVGRGARDMDLPLRWHGSGPEAGRDVERWLNAAMRKLKRRVAPLPARPSDESSTAPFGRDHHEIFYGGIMTIPPRALDAPEQAILDGVHAYEAATPFEERSHGFVHGEARMNGEAPLGIWFGVPLGTLLPITSAEIDEDDLRMLDEDVAQARAQLSHLPDGWFDGRPASLWSSRRTDLPTTSTEALRRLGRIDLWKKLAASKRRARKKRREGQGLKTRPQFARSEDPANEFGSG